MNTIILKPNRYFSFYVNNKHGYIIFWKMKFKQFENMSYNQIQEILENATMEVSNTYLKNGKSKKEVFPCCLKNFYLDYDTKHLYFSSDKSYGFNGFNPFSGETEPLRLDIIVKTKSYIDMELFINKSNDISEFDNSIDFIYSYINTFSIDDLCLIKKAVPLNSELPFYKCNMNQNEIDKAHNIYMNLLDLISKELMDVYIHNEFPKFVMTTHGKNIHKVHDLIAYSVNNFERGQEKN
jgi:hypothetical protein